MPDNIRMKRIASYFMKELARIVFRELKDPVFENKLISFSEVNISRDLARAEVMVTVLGDRNDLGDIVETLNSAEPFIRREIMAVSDLRRVPVFTFQEDPAIEVASRIDSILNKLDIPPESSGDESEDK